MGAAHIQALSTQLKFAARPPSYIPAGVSGLRRGDGIAEVSR